MNTTLPPWRILLVEDNLGDICLLRLALKEAALNCELTVLNDGGEGLAFVRREGKYAGVCRPDMAVIDQVREARAAFGRGRYSLWTGDPALQSISGTVSAASRISNRRYSVTLICPAGRSRPCQLVGRSRRRRRSRRMGCRLSGLPTRPSY